MTAPDIVQAFAEALDFWLLHIQDLPAHVAPAKVENPLAELVKLAKLIKAHTTKVGIVYEPAKLEHAGEAAHNAVSDLSKLFVLFISALALLKAISKLFHNEISKKSAELVSAASALAQGLQDQRLVLVGKVWSVCDELVSLVEGGSNRCLEQKTKMHLLLIEDGLDEFAEFLENPDGFDFDSDSEFGSADSADSDSEGVLEAEADTIKKVGSEWLRKLKLVRLLFLSISKSLPKITAPQDIDDIYAQQVVVFKKVDNLVVDLMSKDVENAEEHGLAVDKAAKAIVKILEKANTNSESKVRWCAAWLAKYNEGTTDKLET